MFMYLLQLQQFINNVHQCSLTVLTSLNDLFIVFPSRDETHSLISASQNSQEY